MKKKKDYTIVLLIGILVTVFTSLPGCYEESISDNRCPYEGAECPNAQRYLQDFQVQVYYDTVWIYDKERLVGRFVTNWNSQWDSILLNDNQ